MKFKKFQVSVLFLMVCVISISVSAEPVHNDRFDKKAAEMAEACRKDVVRLFTGWLESGKLTQNQLFDRFYIPVPGTNPKKFNTQYDSLTDEFLQPILEKYLSDEFVFVIAVDVNGYVPTHNIKYSRETIGITAMDLTWNRTKRMFNDRTGIAAARNMEPFLIQKYQRDTGEEMYDYSVPVIIRGDHWGAIRVGYQKKNKIR